MLSLSFLYDINYSITTRQKQIINIIINPNMACSKHHYDCNYEKYAHTHIKL